MQGTIIGDTTKPLERKITDYAKDDRPGMFDTNATLKLAVSKAEKNYDEQGTVDELYQKFLDAIQHHAPKIMGYPTKEDWKKAGSPCWNNKSKFKEYCAEALTVCEYRLEEEKRKKKEKDKPIILDTQLGSYLGGMKNGLGDFEPSDNALINSTDPEILEIRNMLIKKNIKTLKKVIRGELKVTNMPVTDETIEEGLGIKNWDDGRKEDMIKNLKKIPQQQQED